MYPIPPSENLVESKTCRKCQAGFPITDKDLEFYDKVSPNFGGKKYSIPSPTLCPDCRQQRRLSFRNERKLYKRKCDATGKDIVSIYAPCEMKGSMEVPLGRSPDKPFKVYHQDFWWSDKWDPMDYGRSFDFTKLFFAQFAELSNEVPRVNIINKESQNSEYTNLSAFNKDSYLLVESSNNESCLYGYWLQKTKDAVDCAFLGACENCYSTIDSSGCYGLSFSQNCKDCSNGMLLRDCVNCHDCIACVGVSGGRYMFLGKQYTESEYRKMEAEVHTKSEALDKIRTQYQVLGTQAVRKYADISHSENARGDYIENASNIRHGFEIHDAQDVAYSSHVWFDSNNCMDVDTVGLNCSYIYESINTAVNSVGNIFCNRCWSISQSILCNECNNSSHLFGCIGLRNKSYCIQ